MIYLTPTSIIKSQDESNGVITGYDLITESLVSEKVENCQPFPIVALKLLQDDTLAYRVAREFTKTDLETAPLIGKTWRTVVRIKNKMAQ